MLSKFKQCFEKPQVIQSSTTFTEFVTETMAPCGSFVLQQRAKQTLFTGNAFVISSNCVFISMKIFKIISDILEHERGIVFVSL